ncbi:MAG: DnaJ domain-containing protein [Pseudomonadota bacterium]|nr:DnaJ domain-containing protein [Pseudomonadota bacterium]
MQWLILGACLLLALVVGAGALVNTDPKRIARTLRLVGGLLLGAAGLGLTLRGFGMIGIPAGLFGLSLFARGLGFRGFGLGGPRVRRQPSGGTSSGVSTDSLEMRLDHDSGTVDGRILRGAMKGRMLSDLDQATLVGLWQDWTRDDPEAARLLEGYLDRVHGADWRPGDHRDSRAKGGGGALTVAEAREILGIGPDASADDIRAAYRRLMKDAHPDHGGSAWYAARLNEARDLLLRT